MLSPYTMTIGCGYGKVKIKVCIVSCFALHIVFVFFCDGKALKFQIGKGKLRLDHHLLPQFAKPHRLRELLYRDGIVQKRFRIIEIGIIGAVACNQIIGIYVHAEIVDQILLGPPCHRRFYGKEAVLYQHGDPIENGIVRAVQM